MTQQDDDLIVSGQDIQEPCPEGTHDALCVDVFAGEDDEYDGKLVPQVWLVWQVFPKDEDGNLLRQGDGRVFQAERKFGRSITPKARLCEFLELWRRKKFTPEERAGFNLSKLKGVPCRLTITQNQFGETTYANVAGVDMFVDENDKPITDQSKWPKAEKYVRGDYSKRTNRNRKAAAATASATTVATAVADDEGFIPF